MAERRGSRRWLHRLPRPVYWAAGAAVAFGGAYASRVLAGDAASVQQVVIWLGGATLIFIGLAILSMGTRARLETERALADDEDRPNAVDDTDDRRRKGP